MKKNEKMDKNDEQRKKTFFKKLIQTQNPQRFPGFTYRCWCNYFRQNLRRFPWILFRNVSLPRWKWTARFGVSPFFRRKSDNFHRTWNKNTHFTDENQRNKIAEVSTSNYNYSIRIIEPFNNNNTQQHTTTHNNTQQHTTTHNNTQQHTTTHNNTHNNTQQQQQQQ